MLLAVCWFVLLLFADMTLRPVERVWLMENHRAKEPKLHSLLPSAVSVEYLLCARRSVDVIINISLDSSNTSKRQMLLLSLIHR